MSSWDWGNRLKRDYALQSLLWETGKRIPGIHFPIPNTKRMRAKWYLNLEALNVNVIEVSEVPFERVMLSFGGFNIHIHANHHSTRTQNREPKKTFNPQSQPGRRNVLGRAKADRNDFFHTRPGIDIVEASFLVVLAGLGVGALGLSAFMVLLRVCSLGLGLLGFRVYVA